jgi:hypothetical protein
MSERLQHATFTPVDSPHSELSNKPSLINNEFWSYGDFELVGHGKQTNANCGRFVSFKGCLHIELHNKTTLDGKNYKGMVYVRKVHASCDKPTCPVCCKSGWGCS